MSNFKELAKKSVYQIHRKSTKKTLEESVRDRYVGQNKLAKSQPKAPSQDASFPPGPLDAKQHSVQRWGSHVPEVYHGMSADTVPAAPKSIGVTSQTRFIGGQDKKPRAVVKPPMNKEELNIRPEQEDSAATSYMMHPNFRTSHREAAFHLMADKVFGLGDFVPKTTVFRHPRTNEPWSAQEFVPDSESLTHPKQQLHRYDNSDILHRLAIMDTVLGNNDRHKGNILIDPKHRLHLVDNAGAFEYAHRFQTPTPEYAKHIQRQPVPASTHAWLSKISPEKMADTLTQAGAPSDVTNLALKRLAEAKRWSRAVSANPEASKELGGVLQAIMTHKFTDSPEIFDDIRRRLYDRIRRGEHISDEQAASPDLTVAERV